MNGFRELCCTTKFVVKKESKSMSPSNYLRKVEEKSDLGKIPSVFQAKNDVCLDFLAWVSQEQPAAARSVQRQLTAAR